MKRREFIELSSKSLGGLLIYSLAGEPLVVNAEEGKGKNARLTALIGLSKMPAHTGLLKDAVSSLRAKADI